jgi:hypothetical protein
MEGVVHAQLTEDLALLRNNEGFHVLWLETDLEEFESEFVLSVESSDTPAVPDVASVAQPLTDWTGDAYYVPAGGTSTVSTSGTLQKFWLDPASKVALSGTQDGLEIDTNITPRSAATCGSSGVSSNMPGFYMDTEAFDVFGSARVCSVGTVNAGSLQVGTLYWTWHPFASLNTGANPKFDILYQPSKWCSWVGSSATCNGNKPWCMCSRSDLPIEWLISYNYNEAPNVEKSWIKN